MRDPLSPHIGFVMRLPSARRVLGVVLLLVACRHAPPPATTPAPSARSSPVETPPARPPVVPPPAGDLPRPYAMVIPPTARSQQGVFKVHQVGTRFYFEVPRPQWDQDFLVTTSLSGTAGTIPIYGAFGGQQQVRFERREHRILLRSIGHDRIASDSALMPDLGMQMVRLAPILANLPIEAYGPDSAAVIEVSRLFLGGVTEWTANDRRATVDANRSFIERVSTYRTNVNVIATQTFVLQGVPGVGGAPPSTQTESYAFSLVRLPTVPMRPRLYDARVEYFPVSALDFGSSTHRVVARNYIRRWRLECAAPAVNGLCTPTRPITYYVDPATPGWLVPAVKAGIEAWRPAFEAAGFRDAIIAADAPDDPTFSGEDASVSMVRWLASPVPNAVGPSVVDPRSGEILDADVQMHQNITDVFANLYFSQVAHLDPRAQRFPLPRELLAELVRYVVAHEVGHTLGLPHNMAASATYPVDSLRSKSWLARMGHTPSIMDYARMNYLVQPEDGIPIDLLIPRIGPYDHFAIRWGYMPVATSGPPEAELPVLEQLVRQQDSVPWFRSASALSGPDPADQVEAVGDENAVVASRLGFRNLRRIMPLVANVSQEAPYADNTAIQIAYNAVIMQWGREAGHVAQIIGGQYRREKKVGQPGVRFTPVPAHRQREAMQFLNEEVFATPTYLLDKGVLRRLEADGALQRISNQQGNVLNSLLGTARLQRLVEHGALDPRPYTLSEMLGALRRGVWNELSTGAAIDPFRQRLQRLYLEAMATRLTPVPPTASPIAMVEAAQLRDIRPHLKAEVRALDASLASAIARTRDTAQRAHLADARDQVRLMLRDPS